MHTYKLPSKISPQDPQTDPSAPPVAELVAAVVVQIQEAVMRLAALAALMSQTALVSVAATPLALTAVVGTLAVVVGTDSMSCSAAPALHRRSPWRPAASAYLFPAVVAAGTASVALYHLVDTCRVLQALGSLEALSTPECQLGWMIGHSDPLARELMKRARGSHLLLQVPYC
jgi:hypothetical protein